MKPSIKTICDSWHAGAARECAPSAEGFGSAGNGAAPHGLRGNPPGRDAISRLGSLMILIREPSREDLARVAAILFRHAAGHWILGIHGHGTRPACTDSAREEATPFDVIVGRIMHFVPETLGASARLTAFVPVGADPVLDAAFRAHGAGYLDAPRAALVGSVLLSVAGILPVAPEGDHAFLEGTIRAVLLAALSRDCGRDAARPESKRRLRRHVEGIIERNLASARLDAARIARLAGISRTTLYRLFEGTGGVAARVQRLRLDRVVDALRDPSQLSTPITAIAERNGFHCIASFNRSFRRAYGTTPGRFRAMRLADAAAPSATLLHATPDASPTSAEASGRRTRPHGGKPASTTNAKELAIPAALSIRHHRGRMATGAEEASPACRLNSLLP